MRVAAAIVADAAAFVVWNLAARSPVRLARDLAAGFTQPRVLLSGLLRIVAGLALLAVGAMVLIPLALQSRTFTILETWTLLTGLLVEQLIGSELRPRAN